MKQSRTKGVLDSGTHDGHALTQQFADDLAAEITEQLRSGLACDRQDAHPEEFLISVSRAIQRRLVAQMQRTQAAQRRDRAKRVYYISMEFLVGQSLANNLLNLGLYDACAEALRSLGSNLERVAALEPDAALGNGGLGRLASCFVDSMATLGLAGTGCGVRYDFGLFRQEIIDGRQREKPDGWNAESSPWLLERCMQTHQIPLYGRIEHSRDRDGGYNPMWLDWKSIIGVPYDMPVAGFGGQTVNRLRLYAARASDSFDIGIFNSGDYLHAVEQKIASENISKVLYPSDTFDAGRELRLVQEYFLVACTIRDVIAEFLTEKLPFEQLPARVAVQMNDTHPALAVVELMRVLIDEHSIQWDLAWQLTRGTLAYTNHTLLPEALEKWPAALMEHVLPRHMQIIYEINRRFLEEAAAAGRTDPQMLRRLSLIEEAGPKHVRMANLAIVGSHSVNGVAALHSALIKSRLAPDFNSLYPERFNNKTNGVTPRRWILQANPRLADLLTRTIGPDWVTDLEQLRLIEPLARQPSFTQELAAIKRANKERLAVRVYEQQRLKLDPDSMFDIQSKRMHEYKRQLLHVLHVIHLYLCVVEDGLQIQPRTHVFAGKAAPGYLLAKSVIHLINAVADLVNRDPRTRESLRVVFVPDYKVSAAEWIIPAADVSEQISTAGTEASGTGNMKFAMNGALTVGTLDGANIEMLEEIGADDMYIFGLTAAQIETQQRECSYRPRHLYESNGRIRRVLEALVRGFLSPDRDAFRAIHDSLMWHDPYFVLADFEFYVAIHQRVATDFADKSRWSERAVRNIARMGRFSSDRTVREYAREVWGVGSTGGTVGNRYASRA